MTAKQMAAGCPNRIRARHRYHCKGLVGQPNGTVCDPENCAALYMADLLVNELRAEIYEMLGGTHEHAKSTAASPGGDKG